jgi:hypothetical protein
VPLGACKVESTYTVVQMYLMNVWIYIIIKTHDTTGKFWCNRATVHNLDWQKLKFVNYFLWYVCYTMVQ